MINKDIFLVIFHTCMKFEYVSLCNIKLEMFVCDDKGNAVSAVVYKCSSCHDNFKNNTFEGT